MMEVYFTAWKTSSLRISRAYVTYKVNKASVSQLQEFAKISVVDGAIYFAPKIITKITDY